MACHSVLDQITPVMPNLLRFFLGQIVQKIELWRSRFINQSGIQPNRLLPGVDYGLILSRIYKRPLAF